jgi:hypothetical protein
LTVLDPTGIRFSVTGNVLGIEHPRAAWGKYFEHLPVSEFLIRFATYHIFSQEAPLSPVPFSIETLSDTGKNPVKKVCKEHLTIALLLSSM